MTTRISLADSFTSIPFRRKLTLITLAVTAVALLLSCIGLIGVQYYYDRDNANQQVHQLADVLAKNLGAAVVFQDNVTANTITNSAKAVPNLLVIEVRDSAGKQVSLYRSASLTAGQATETLAVAGDQPGQSRSLFSGVGTYTTPILVNEERVGTLKIGYRYRSLVSILINTLPVAVLLFAGCMIFATFVSGRLRRMMFQPLDRLNQSMTDVRASGSLDARVAKSSDPDFDSIISNYNAMLEEIDARTAELSVAMDELAVARDHAEEANVAKSAFLANMSHELRTPLNAIIGYAEVLGDDLKKAGLSRSVEDLGWIYSSSKQLLELINSLLDLSKIEAGKMEVDLHTFDLRKLLAEVEATLQPLADKQGNQLIFTVSPEVGTVNLDSTKLRQSLLNVGSNACKFTENGVIQFNVKYDGQDVVIDVSDTGIGMNDDDIERLFEPFVQSDSSTTRRFGGTGLGLALVKRFTELLKGSVSVSSMPGYGSTFTIRVARDLTNELLPQDRATDPGAEAVVAPRTADRARPLALIMEDEPSAVELLKRLLDRNGYQCVVAGDGEAGLDMAKAQEPDLVLLDIGLPRIDGWEVLEQFAMDERLRAIPTVVISVDDRKQVSIDLGASDHLVKPVQTEELDAILKLYSTKKGHNILLVEDDPATGQMYERGLQQCGFNVTRAMNGAEASTLLALGGYAMVVTDLMMPQSDGYELISRIAEIPAESRPPVIVVTGAMVPMDKQAQLEGNVNSIHLKSGLTPRRLAERISELLHD